MAAEVEYRCFVGDLAWATTDQTFCDAFSQIGKVVDSKIINDRETGRSRGFGFVNFSNKQSMRDTIESMNDQDLDGRNITVNEAQSRRGGGGGEMLFHSLGIAGDGSGMLQSSWRKLTSATVTAAHHCLPPPPIVDRFFW